MWYNTDLWPIHIFMRCCFFHPSFWTFLNCMWFEKIRIGEKWWHNVLSRDSSSTMQTMQLMLCNRWRSSIHGGSNTLGCMLPGVAPWSMVPPPLPWPSWRYIWGLPEAIKHHFFVWKPEVMSKDPPEGPDSFRGCQIQSWMWLIREGCHSQGDVILWPQEAQGSGSPVWLTFFLNCLNLNS